MKKSIFILIFLPKLLFAQISVDPNASLDQAIDHLWQSSTPSPATIQDVGPEVLGNDQMIAPVLAPSRTRTSVPGSDTVLLPIEQSGGPLNLSPNDSKAYILYNRATIAYRKQEFEKARELYRELVRRYPHSSYTPYALYTLSLSEKDYRRKIRILLTIKERFPDFSNMSLILDRLGDVYYILGSSDAAAEVFKESKSTYALYMQAIIALDSQKPNQAIKIIREFLKRNPDKESAYKAYIVYSESLLLLRKYKETIMVLEKSTELRPWAFDNGAAILLNAGKAYYHNKQFAESLYAFSVLRLRFSRSTESRLADQYITSLSKMNVVDMKTVSWIAKEFDTLIKEQPVSRFIAPSYPTANDVRSMNTNLPRTGVNEPSLADVGYVPAMPVPSPQRSRQNVLVPARPDGLPSIELISFTNTVFQEVTNTVNKVITNQVFAIMTNHVTNEVISVSNIYLTNIFTNIIDMRDTNVVQTYESVVVWKTNYINRESTNYVTKIQNDRITNVEFEIFPLWQTNLHTKTNFITNIVNDRITNVMTEVVPIWKTNTLTLTNYKTNIVNGYVTNVLTEVLPIWQTNYKRINFTNYITNVTQNDKTNVIVKVTPYRRELENIMNFTNHITNVVNGQLTNAEIEIVPVWKTNAGTRMLTNVTTNTYEELTNVRTEIVPLWYHQTNIVSMTNISTNKTERGTTLRLDVAPIWKINIMPLTQAQQYTNLVSQISTNMGMEILPVLRTNYNVVDREQEQTNLIQKIITNSVIEVQAQWITNGANIYRTNDLTNTINKIITNNFTEIIPKWKASYETIDQERLTTNLTQNIVTNVRLEILPFSLNNKAVFQNAQNITDHMNHVITNTRLQVVPVWRTNIELLIETNSFTNMRNLIFTNGNELITNRVPAFITNVDNEIITNILNFPITNTVNEIKTNVINQVITNVAPRENVQAEIAPVQATITPEPVEEIIPAIAQAQQEFVVSPEIERLQKGANRISERAASIAGNYSIPDNKGYVLRIAELKDLSVVNIMVQDINKLGKNIPVGIFFRDGSYYLEARNIKDHKTAKEMSQTLQRAGYTEAQIFEQFEVVEYDQNIR
ncbi:MAG: tetratricopeptide repeat protein [Brevinema sp.]